MNLRRFATLPLILTFLILPACERVPEKQTKEERIQELREKKRQAEQVAEKKKALEEQIALEAKTKEKALADAKAAAEAEKIAEERRVRKAAEEQEARLLEEERKADAIAAAKRKAACARFVGTKISSLKTVEGKIFNDLEVTAADAIGVTFKYEHGIKRLSYPNLPKEIQDKCLYDPEALAKQKTYEQKLALLRQKQRDTAAAEKKETSPRSTASTARSSSSKPKIDKPTKKVRPAGSISTRVIRMYRKYYGPTLGYSHTKVLKVSVRANVDASLYNRGQMVGSVKARKTSVFETESWMKGKYKLVLKDKNGKILDQEANGSKTGL